jgi:hypothetical protein
MSDQPSAAPNQRWVGDTTEFVLGTRSKLYLANAARNTASSSSTDPTWPATRPSHRMPFSPTVVRRVQR